jgi:hypothetical protein
LYGGPCADREGRLGWAVDGLAAVGHDILSLLKQLN